MSDVPGYRLGTCIYTSSKSLVHRGVRLEDGRRVVIKIPQAARPGLRHVAAYERAYRIANDIRVHGVVDHIDLVRCRGAWALITDDVGATSLDLILRDGTLPLDITLSLAVRCCNILGDLHAAGVVHKDIKPANIIYSVDTDEVRIIDLGISSWLRSEHVTGHEEATLEGTLAYMSPEQTGRMNRSVDNRSDLYSFGVTLFELLTGRRPFPSLEPIELIHAHIARVPPAPSDIRPDLPEMVSLVVGRLLAKTAEERYESAFGVAHDLQVCVDALRDRGSIEPFELGQRDVSSRFRIPERLYGREVEVRHLLEAFRVAASGGKALVAVTGQSGIGKTTLVREIQRPVVRSHGWFCSGKFDQFTRDVPYLALVQALRDLVRQVLARPAELTDRLRDAARAAVGISGRVLTSVVAELEHLIGPQPAVPVLGVAESQNRFARVFLAFIAVFARSEHPLVLFLDDLQWADLASLRWIELLGSEAAASHVLLLVGFRDGEVGAHHPARRTLDTLRDVGLPVYELTLDPLPTEDVCRLVADTLGVPPASVAFAGGVVHEKTGGNPFFVREFLHALHTDGLLEYDTEMRRWDWDDEALALATMTENVVELVSRRILALAPATADVLATAACMGAEFVLGTLAVVTERTVAQTGELLVEALHSGVLLPLDPAYKYVTTETSVASDELMEEVAAVRYRFQHDRVQQAAYALLDEDELAARHLHIGRTLFAFLDEKRRDELAIEIVPHFCHALARINDREERLAVARLHERASRLARQSLAYDSALAFLDAGLTLLEGAEGDLAHELRFLFYEGLVECALGLHRYEDLERHAKRAHQHARTREERARVWVLELRADQSRVRYADAVDRAIRVAAEFGTRLPRNPGRSHVLAEVARTRWAVRSRSPGAWAEREPMTDEDTLALISVIAAAIPPAYFCAPNLMPILAMTIVRLSVARGVCGWSGYGFAVYGLVLSGALGLRAEGHAWGVAGVRVAAGFDRIARARVEYVMGIFLAHYRDSSRVVEAMLLEAWQDSLDVGDEESAVYAAGCSLHHGFLSGVPLSTLLERHGPSMEYVQSSAQDHVKDCFVAWYQLVELLVTSEPSPDSLKGARMDVDVEMERFLATGNGVQVAIASIASGSFAFFLGRRAVAEEHFARASAAEDRILGQILVPIAHWMRALNALFDAAQGAAAECFSPARAMRLARRAERTLSAWSSLEPSLQEVRRDLLRAEMLAARGGGLADVVRTFREVAERAMAQGRPCEEALAWERLAFYARRAHIPDLPEWMDRNAHGAWERWGCRMMCARRETRALPDSAFYSGPTSLLSEQIISATHESLDGQGVAERLDMASLIKSVRNLSREIDLTRLTSRTLDIVIENAGATLGALLLVTGRQTDLVAFRSTLSSPETVPLRSDERASFFRPAVEYVLRSQMVLAVDDLQRDERFASVLAEGASTARSLATIPIQLQGQLLGVVHLENHLIGGAFTAERVAFSSMIAAQAAVAIENARLFAKAQDALRAEVELNRANARFVPRAFIQGLGRRGIADVSPGDAVQKEMSVMFADIRNFTSMVETMSPEDTIHFVNEYVAQVQPAISECGGFVDSFSGDGILALFDGGPEAAIASGAGILRALELYNHRRTRDGLCPVGIGIGINAGLLTMGTIGSDARLQCTVLGDTVNVASRVEALTRRYPVEMLVTQDVMERIREPNRVPSRLVANVRLHGRKKPIRVYEVVRTSPDHDASARIEMLATFQHATEEFYSHRFAAARSLFCACLDADPTDELASDYIRRCDEQQHQDGWDGVDVPPLR